MTTRFTCGHEGSWEEGVSLILKSTRNDYENWCLVPCTTYVVFCRDCADRAEREGYVLHNVAEEDEYLDSDSSEWVTL